MGKKINAGEIMKQSALAGRLTLPSATVNGVSVDSRRIEVGTRYFFEMPSLDQTDADLGVSLANVDVSGGGFSESDSALLLSGQLRRAMNRQIGKSKYAINEAYGGAQVAVGDLTSRALHAGLLVDLNPKVSANAEVMVDDGAHLRLGIRMDLAKPDAPRRAALLRKKEPVAETGSQPETAALEAAPEEADNRVVSFFRKLFRQGPEATASDVAAPVDGKAVPLIEAAPATGASTVQESVYTVPGSQ